MVAALLFALVQPGVYLYCPDAQPVIDLSDDYEKALWLEVANCTKEPVTVWSADFWVNHRMVVTRTDGSPAARTAAGVAAGRRFKEPRRDHNVPIEILPCKKWRYQTVRISDYFVLSPGWYVVEVVYEDDSRGFGLRLEGLPILVRVEE
jgi:hypothetical protein